MPACAGNLEREALTPRKRDVTFCIGICDAELICDVTFCIGICDVTFCTGNIDLDCSCPDKEFCSWNADWHDARFDLEEKSEASLMAPVMGRSAPDPLATPVMGR